jgi:Spy/CpxP family protein refolding chaperone
MEKGKRYFVVGGTVLFIMLFAGFGLVAGCGPCRGFHRGSHPGFHNKDFSEHILRKVDKRVEALNLSEAQKEKYKEIKGKLETRLKEHMDDRKRLMKEIQTEMKKEEPDVKALSESIKKQMKRFPDFMEGNLDLFVEFYETLDKEQKDKIISTMRKKMKRCWKE